VEASSTAKKSAPRPRGSVSAAYPRTRAADASGEQPSLWVPEDVPHPWTVSGARVHERRRADEEPLRAGVRSGATFALMSDAEAPSALRFSAAPDDVPPPRAEPDRPALEAAQSLVNVVHEALRQDLADLRRQLASLTGRARPPVSSPTGSAQRPAPGHLNRYQACGGRAGARCARPVWGSAS
jgi:hypothetical protein